MSSAQGTSAKGSSARRISAQASVDHWSVEPSVSAFLSAAVSVRPRVESCGLLVGRRGPHGRTVQRATLSPNRSGSGPADAFALDPRHLMTVDTDARGRGEVILGVWHSHPSGSAIPSARDERELPHLDWIYGIVPTVQPLSEGRSPGGAAPLDDVHPVTWWTRVPTSSGDLTRVDPGSRSARPI